MRREEIHCFVDFFIRLEEIDVLTKLCWNSDQEVFLCLYQKRGTAEENAARRSPGFIF